MKIQVLRGSKGEVIGTFERTLGGLTTLEAEVGEGQGLEEVELPDEYVRMPTPDFIKRLEADIQAKRLELKPVTQ